jgi:hypothetical protein
VVGRSTARDRDDQRNESEAGRQGSQPEDRRAELDGAIGGHRSQDEGDGLEEHRVQEQEPEPVAVEETLRSGSRRRRHHPPKWW